jgi:hypothetical protein
VRKSSVAAIFGVISFNGEPPDFKIAGIVSGTPFFALMG